MSTRKILLVDDSKSARYALRLLLQKHDCEVDTAESGESALEKVQQSLPDAIFMDHLMPGMNGFEALDALKADGRTTHIPVVMCTSNDDAPYQRQALEKGALGILPKPATPQKLEAVLQAIDAASAGAPQPIEEVTLTEVAPPPVEAPVAAPPAAPPAAQAMGSSEISALVRDEVRGLLDSEIRSLVDSTLENRLQSVRAELSEFLMARSAQQLAEWSEAEMASIREELHKADHSSEFSARLEGEIQQMKSELVEMETNHAQAVVQKISREILPDLVQTQADEISRHIQQRISLQLDELAERLSTQIPQNPQLIRAVIDAAETAAEHKAEAIAKTHAREVAEYSAEEKANEMSEYLMDSAQSASGKIYAVAGAAAAIGVLAAAAVYFLLS